MPIDKKISGLNPATALELLIDAEIAIAPIGSTQTLKASLEAIADLIGGEKTYMDAGDPLIATGRERDNYLNTDTGAFFKKEAGIWNLKYQFASGTGTGNVNQSFETLVYAAAKTVAYNPIRPKKKITLTGDISITNTGTSNGSHGIYLLIQDSTGSRSATINGQNIQINPYPDGRTVIGWMYDGTNYDFSTNYIPNTGPVLGITDDINNTFQLI